MGDAVLILPYAVTGILVAFLAASRAQRWQEHEFPALAADDRDQFRPLSVVVGIGCGVIWPFYFAWLFGICGIARLWSRYG